MNYKILVHLIYRLLYISKVDLDFLYYNFYTLIKKNYNFHERFYIKNKG